MVDLLAFPYLPGNSYLTDAYHEVIAVEAPARTGHVLEVLIADDSPVYRKLIENALAGKDYSLSFAKSGNEALDLCRERRPQVLITDWMMPDLTGIELCEKLRADSKRSYTYIILLTSMSETGNIVKGLSAGADDYLTKPFHAEELIARIGVGRRVADLQRQIEAKNHLLKELALTDALTGLPNRRAVEDWVNRQLQGAARHGFPLWVVLTDLDHFKKINDTYGHAVGDTVLKEFASVLKSSTRQSDMCARIGGEEFVVVMSHGEREGAIFAVNRIRKQIEAHNFTFEGGRVTITASFGVAGFTEGMRPDFHQILAQADAALYTAKNQGRNRVEYAEIP
jgi:diguanylate cyclase (GGDEF)-like protein